MIKERNERNIYRGVYRMNGEEALTVNDLITILKGISEAGSGDLKVMHSKNLILSVESADFDGEKYIKLKGVEPE